MVPRSPTATDPSRLGSVLPGCRDQFGRRRADIVGRTIVPLRRGTGQLKPNNGSACSTSHSAVVADLDLYGLGDRAFRAAPLASQSLGEVDPSALGDVLPGPGCRGRVCACRRSAIGCTLRRSRRRRPAGRTSPSREEQRVRHDQSPRTPVPVTPPAGLPSRPAAAPGATMISRQQHANSRRAAHDPLR